jgi:hypothetical protein
MGRRRGRPGLIGVAARTAVIAGTAQATAGAVSHHQQNKYDQQAGAQAQAPAPVAPAAQPAPPAPPAPPPQAAGSTDLLGQLQQLADLQAAGVLTPEEFAAAKAKLLA